MFGHPFGAGEMTFPSAAGAFGLTRRVDVEHDASHLRPVGIVGFGIEEPEIGDELPMSYEVRPSVCGASSSQSGSSGGLGLCIDVSSARFDC